MLKYFTIITLLLLISCSKSSAGLTIDYVTPGHEINKTICEESGGNWHMLNDGCGDKCFRYEGSVVRCTMALKPGCDCGPNRCLDSETKKCRSIKNNQQSFTKSLN